MKRTLSRDPTLQNYSHINSYKNRKLHYKISIENTVLNFLPIFIFKIFVIAEIIIKRVFVIKMTIQDEFYMKIMMQINMRLFYYSIEILSKKNIGIQ